MYCLDTYALIEMRLENPAYAKYLSCDIIIPEPVLAEYYYVLYRQLDRSTADKWFEKLKVYRTPTSVKNWIDALIYRHEHKRQNLSVFDCIGYIYSLDNGYTFVTGDKEFKNKKGVEYVK